MSCPKTGVWAYKSSDTDELKYSVRSAIKNLSLERIIIVGDKPNWLQESEQAIYVPFVPNRTPEWTRSYVAWQYLDKLMTTGLIKEDFLYFNDDFFILQPIEEWIDYQRDLVDYNTKVKAHNHVYHIRDMRALKLLRMEEEHHYNLHIPIKLNPANLIIALTYWRQSAWKDFEFRTFYGCQYLKDAPYMMDVKYNPNNLFYSSGDDVWKVSGQQYRDMFPDKSYAERHN